MATLATLLSTALFWAPQRVHGLKRALSWGWMRRWREAGLGWRRTCCVRLTTSLDAQRGLLASGATFVSWTARFMTLNALMMALVVAAFPTALEWAHFDVWARQLSMWTVMMISPTPGSSGLAELALPAFLMDVMPAALTAALWATLVLAWRYLTYHLYVLVGGVLMPFWLAKTVHKHDQS